jgi:hypothetical protein
LLNTTDWEQSVTLTCSDVTANFSIVQFSTCGKYLVATTCEGDFVIFSVEMDTVCGKSKHPNATAICGLMWNPSGKSLTSNSFFSFIYIFFKKTGKLYILTLKVN